MSVAPRRPEETQPSRVSVEEHTSDQTPADRHQQRSEGLAFAEEDNCWLAVQLTRLQLEHGSAPRSGLHHERGDARSPLQRAR